MHVTSSQGKTTIRLTKAELKAIETAANTFEMLANLSDNETAEQLEASALMCRETVKMYETTK